MSDERGQVFALEAIVGALLVVASVVFVLQSVAVTPVSGSTSSQYVENQQHALTRGVLDVAAADDSLRETLLYWNNSSVGFHDAPEKGYYTSCALGTAFGDLLERTFTDRGIACNVDVQYVTATGAIRRQKVVYVGEPTDNAARATATVTLYDDDVLRAADGTPTNTTLREATRFFAPDAAPNDPTYNVVVVEVVTWRR